MNFNMNRFGKLPRNTGIGKETAERHYNQLYSKVLSEFYASVNSKEYKFWKVLEMMLGTVGEAYGNILICMPGMGLSFVNGYVRNPSLGGFTYQMCIEGVEELWIEITELEGIVCEIRMRGCQNTDENYNIVKSAVQCAYPHILWAPSIVCKQDGKIYATGEAALHEVDPRFGFCIFRHGGLLDFTIKQLKMIT